jgi:ketosteroid isomerase-like protein
MRSMLFVLLVGALASHAAAQSNFPADEKALRDLAAKLDTGMPAEETPNGIVFTGALRQPRVRGEAPAQPIARVQGRQFVEARTTIRRIEFASSGDMAYVFSDSDVTYRVNDPDGQMRDQSFTNSALRVFRKIGGKWLQAAHFAAPHRDESGQSILR